ncbi:kinesin-associated protein 3 [Phlebotomus papatasi]|uniref:kinesin-associated protein 3 n=1 Tax=Phlebotomus papatasi TaxID=29031 RepID=UPI0024840E37|nr:kinesin-associated protein 3 [Phlebotomus papatasi]
MLSLVFQLISGLILLLFCVHYIYYIIAFLITDDMQSEDAKYIKKRWKGGSIEPHPTEKAIIVHYKLEAAVFAEPGDPMLEEKKDCQRVIRLKNLSAKTDPATLAREVVEKCDLIHNSQLSDVEQIIYYLKNRRDNISNDMDNQRAQSRIATEKGSMVSSAELEKASIRVIDTYVELLYDELPDKIRGSALILQLARNPDNLEELEKNEAVLCALSRVLREDWRKSLDLSTNIVYIFFCFSTYTHFHPVIVNHKIGSLCMDVIDYELKRYEQMKNDLEMRRNPDGKPEKQVVTQQSTESADMIDIMNEEKPKDMEPPRRRIPELKQRPKSGNWSSFHGSLSSVNPLVKSRAMNNSYHEFLSNEVECGVKAEKDAKTQKEEYEKLNKQLRIFAKKQEQLLRVAFYLLLNIAENVKLEEKMRKKMIIRMLVKVLERQNIDLLILVVTFLKKLSIVKDNKDEMYEMNVVEKLPRLLQSTHPDLIQVTLKLIFNLSFDGPLRGKMIRVGFLPKLVTFLSDDKHHDIVLKILYHMSMDDKVKSMFTYTDCVPLITDMLLLNLNQKSDMDLIALAINLALNKRNAQIMIENNRLHNLMVRAFKYQDALLMKMIRNISHHENLRIHFVDFVGDLAKILTECDDEAFVVECLGIMGNLALPDLDYSQILHNFNLIQWIRQVLVPGKMQDDIVLDTIVFLGTCACDESCAMFLCKADVILSLIELLKAKQEDDEIVLQIVFVFQQILRNESTRNYMIRETESPAYLIDLMHDKNTEIRKVCDNCLDIIAFSDSDWASRIKLEKFRNHNAQWLTMVETQQDHEDSQDFGNVDDVDLQSFIPSEYLDQCRLYQSGESNDDSESNYRATSVNSNGSRPLSSHDEDFEGKTGKADDAKFPQDTSMKELELDGEEEPLLLA